MKYTIEHRSGADEVLKFTPSMFYDQCELGSAILDSTPISRFKWDSKGKFLWTSEVPGDKEEILNIIGEAECEIDELISKARQWRTYQKLWEGLSKIVPARKEAQHEPE